MACSIWSWYAVVKLSHQGAVERQLDRPCGLGHGLDIVKQHFLGEILVMEDVLFQLREDFLLGGADGESHGIGIGQSIVLAEDPQQAAADLAVGGQLYFHILIVMEQDVFRRLADTGLPHIVVELMDVCGQLSLKGCPSLSGDFHLDHFMHFLPEMEKAGRLLSEKIFQRPAMYFHGERASKSSPLALSFLFILLL